MATKLEDYMTRMRKDEVEAMMPHLEGGTPSWWIAEALSTHGYPISERAIRRHRRKMRTGIAR